MSYLYGSLEGATNLWIRGPPEHRFPRASLILDHACCTPLSYG